MFGSANSKVATNDSPAYDTPAGVEADPGVAMIIFPRIRTWPNR